MQNNIVGTVRTPNNIVLNLLISIFIVDDDWSL